MAEMSGAEYSLGEAKCAEVIEKLRRRLVQNAYELQTVATEELSLVASKLGGMPYWPRDLEYPHNAKGEKLTLLAQLNLAELPLPEERLPQQGILQFFILAQSGYGKDYYNKLSRDGARIVYHREVDDTVDEALVRSWGIVPNTELDLKHPAAFPLTQQFSLIANPIRDCGAVDDIGFADILQEALVQEAGDIAKEAVLNSEEKQMILEAFAGTWGHKLLGYIQVNQQDPRYVEGAERYDTMLLQIDSDEEAGIMWGDLGVGHFFVNGEDLKKGDFSEFMYHWDSY